MIILLVSSLCYSQNLVGDFSPIKIGNKWSYLNYEDYSKNFSVGNFGSRQTTSKYTIEITNIEKKSDSTFIFTTEVDTLISIRNIGICNYYSIGCIPDTTLTTDSISITTTNHEYLELDQIYYVKYDTTWTTWQFLFMPHFVENECAHSFGLLESTSDDDCSFLIDPVYFSDVKGGITQFEFDENIYQHHLSFIYLSNSGYSATHLQNIGLYEYSYYSNFPELSGTSQLYKFNDSIINTSIYESVPIIKDINKFPIIKPRLKTISYSLFLTLLNPSNKFENPDFFGIDGKSYWNKINQGNKELQKGIFYFKYMQNKKVHYYKVIN